MDSVLEAAETAIAWIGLAAIGLTLVLMFTGLRRSDRLGADAPSRPPLLRWPVLIVFALIWVGFSVALWFPLPLQLGPVERWALLVTGAVLLFGGLALYLWGLATLGDMFGASSAFVAPLKVGHRLVTTGPFALVRHPMYLALILAVAGVVVIYRTWAGVANLMMFIWLPLRARREERTLAARFGAGWEEYQRRVPGWIPRLTPWKG